MKKELKKDDVVAHNDEQKAILVIDTKPDAEGFVWLRFKDNEKSYRLKPQELESWQQYLDRIKKENATKFEEFYDEQYYNKP